MKHFKKYKKCIEFTQILILNKMDCAGRNSAGRFSQKLFCRKKFQHIVNVKAISESEENLDDKQKAYKTYLLRILFGRHGRHHTFRNQCRN